MLEDRSGFLWVGTVDNGLNRLDPKTGHVHHYVSTPGTSGGLGSNTISTLCQDRNGALWIGTTNGLNRLDPKTDHLTHYPASRTDTTRMPYDYISVVYEDRAGTLWLGSKGLSKMNSLSNSFTNYSYVRESGSIEPVTIDAILEDRSGRFWIGSDGGLDQFDRRTGKFISFKLRRANSNSRLHDPVFCLHEDKAGSLWVGTSVGLYQIQANTGHYQLYQQKNGLISNHIIGIVEDDDGYVWLSTPEGLSKFNPTRKTCRNYNAADGLLSDEFTEKAYGKGKDGKLLFGGVNGLNTFYPNKLTNNVHVPPIVLTDFQIFNQSVPIRNDTPTTDQGFTLSQSITKTDAIELPYQANVFSFEFAALDYNRPEKNQYAYWLEGFEKDWVYSGNRRFVTYTNLDPGQYVFRVKGSNNDAIWNEQGRSIRITILPPWWRTWWAYALYMLTGGALLYLVYAYLLSRERLKNELQLERLESEKLHEVDQMKTRFFTNISHEFRDSAHLDSGAAATLDSPAYPGGG